MLVVIGFSFVLVGLGYLVGREIERDRQRYRRERDRSYRLAKQTGN
jgi:hypothetical protein